MAAISGDPETKVPSGGPATKNADPVGCKLSCCMELVWVWPCLRPPQQFPKGHADLSGDPRPGARSEEDCSLDASGESVPLSWGRVQQGLQPRSTLTGVSSYCYLTKEACRRAQVVSPGLWERRLGWGRSGGHQDSCQYPLWQGWPTASQTPTLPPSGA